MSGTLRGKVECLFGLRANAIGYCLVQEMFTSLYNYFKSHPNMTEIARHGGLGGTAANVNYWDVANPFNNNAWYVFKMGTLTDNVLYTGTRTYPWYILVQWNRSDQGLFGVAPGNPGLVDGATNTNTSQLCIQFAIGIGGDQNPWNGSGTLGANTKGTPVWKTPTGGTSVMVFPRSNNVGGNHNTNKENMTAVFWKANNDSTGSRCNILMDDDSMVLLVDWQNNDSWDATYFGLFAPRPSLPLNYPIVMLSTGTVGRLPFFFSNTTNKNVFGSVSGTGTGITSPNNCGGIPASNPEVNGVRGVCIDRYTTVFETGSQYGTINPNKYFSTPTLDEFPIAVIMYETPNYYGYAGQVDFIREAAWESQRVRSTGSGSTRALFAGGTGSIAAVKLSVPWPTGLVFGLAWVQAWACVVALMGVPSV